MSKRLCAGQVALVTGASQGGTGTAIAIRLAAEGAKVAITARSVDGLESTRARITEFGGECLVLPADLSDPHGDRTELVPRIEATWGPIDILVNNAGVFLIMPMSMTSVEEYMRVVRINQVGTFLGMRAVTETMVVQGSGSIVNISSVAGLRGSQGTVAYTASKFAVRGMTKVAALELAPFGVRVNSVHPGLIDTAMLGQLREAAGGNEDLVKARVPTGRVAAADEVAQLVLYLASDESGYSTGAEFVVDGGMTAQF